MFKQNPDYKNTSVYLLKISKIEIANKAAADKKAAADIKAAAEKAVANKEAADKAELEAGTTKADSFYKEEPVVNSNNAAVDKATEVQEKIQPAQLCKVYAGQ